MVSESVSKEQQKQPMFGVASSEVDNLELELKRDLFYDNLAVFIRDPKKPNQYWFRQLKVAFQADPNDVAYENVPMGEFNMIPCPEDELGIAVRNMIDYQQCAEDNEGQVGVAKYVGESILSLGEIIALTAAKYHRTRLDQIDVNQIASS